MPRGGLQNPPGGRPLGSKNQATIEREEQARLVAERLAEVDRLRAEGASEVVAAAKTAGVKLATEVLRDFMHLFSGLAAYYQPVQEGKEPKPGRKPDETLFRVYAALAKDTAKDLAIYESPRLSAVMVGAAIVNRVEVIGGMPDDFAPPVQGKIDIAPGTVITPDGDDDFTTPPPVLKLVGD
jgi:hypothetical protein